MDAIIYDTMQLLAGHTEGVRMKRYRNQCEPSLTQGSLRPDFRMLAAGTMLFKGEEKTQDSELEAARMDLLSKMANWDQAYHGTVSARALMVRLRSPLHCAPARSLPLYNAASLLLRVALTSRVRAGTIPLVLRSCRP